MTIFPLTGQLRFREVSLMLLLLLNLCLLCFGAIVTEIEAGEGVPPKLSHDVRSRITAREGTRSLRLECPVEGNPRPLILWKKDDENIGVAWTRFRTVENDRKLRIRNLVPEDSGRYACEAVNGFGRTVVHFTLIVYGKDDPEPQDFGSYTMPQSSRDVAPFWVNPAHISEQSNAPILPRLGAPVTIKCHASGRPTPDITWYKNGVIIRDSGYFHPNKWTLHIRHVGHFDAGKYVCKVHNVYGALNASFNLQTTSTGSAPPEIEKTHPLNKTVYAGQSATFQCEVKSSVPLHIKWVKRIDDEEQLEENSTVFSAGGIEFVVLQYESRTVVSSNGTYLNKLTIPTATTKTTGWYICVVTDPAGHIVHKSAHLNVLPSDGPGIQPINRTHGASGSISTHLLIVVPVVILVALLASCAIFFLCKHQQKPPPPAPKPGASGADRPPPPSYPPPLLPSAKTNSLSPQRINGINCNKYNFYLENQRYVANSRVSGKQPAGHVRDYQVYDPQACVPLNTSFVGDERDYLYEQTTPQPYEIDYEHSDLEYIPEGGRLQPYPSLYSCR